MKWSVPYVAVVTLLGCEAFTAQPLLFPWTEVAAFALLLPTLVVELPVIYVVGAMAWNVREGMAGQPMWPVTVTFTVLFFASAVLNAVLVRYLVRAVTSRWRPRPPQARGPSPPGSAPRRWCSAPRRTPGRRRGRRTTSGGARGRRRPRR